MEKKYRLDNRIKVCIIAVLIVIISVLIYMILNKFIPVYQEQAKSVCQYGSKANIDYTVILDDNPIYSDKVRKKGETYVSTYVDYIDVSYDYIFNCEYEADIKATYSIKAYIEGAIGEDDNKKVIWSKQSYELSPTEAKIVDKTFDINKDIRVNFQQYREFATKIVEETKIGTNVILKLCMDIDIVAITEKGKINEQMAPNIIIPLSNGYFDIKEDYQKERVEAINIIESIRVKTDYKQIIVYCMALLVSIAVTVIFALNTKGELMDPLQVKINQILKNYDEQLICVNTEIDIKQPCMMVSSMEDLSKISDEINQPILYLNSEDKRDITLFVLNDVHRSYVLDLRSEYVQVYKEVKIDNNI